MSLTIVRARLQLCVHGREEEEKTGSAREDVGGGVWREREAEGRMAEREEGRCAARGL